MLICLFYFRAPSLMWPRSHGYRMPQWETIYYLDVSFIRLDMTRCWRRVRYPQTWTTCLPGIWPWLDKRYDYHTLVYNPTFHLLDVVGCNIIQVPMAFVPVYNAICTHFYLGTMPFVPGYNATCTWVQCHLYLGTMPFVPGYNAICTWVQCHLYLGTMPFVPRYNAICAWV